MRPPKGCQDIPAVDVFNNLDALSRTRALDDYESELLEEAIGAMNASQWNLRLSGRDAARYGVKRDKSFYSGKHHGGPRQLTKPGKRETVAATQPGGSTHAR